MARIILFALVFSGCSVFGPSTELQVINETGDVLSVELLPCVIPRSPLRTATLDDAGLVTWQVEPGCLVVEGITDDGRGAAFRVDVVEGTLHRVPFSAEDVVPF